MWDVALPKTRSGRPRRKPSVEKATRAIDDRLPSIGGRPGPLLTKTIFARCIAPGQLARDCTAPWTHDGGMPKQGGGLRYIHPNPSVQTAAEAAFLFIVR